MVLEYKRERTEFSEGAHEFAKELTEAVNSYINEIKGDEIQESLDVGMIVGRKLMGGNRRENINELVDGFMLFSINAGKSAMEPDKEPT